MADKPQPAPRQIWGIPDGRDHDEASQGSGETSKNFKIAEQIVNQVKQETRTETNEGPARN